VVLPRIQTPVAIIGAGPVGQTAALLLARWGIASVLVDAEPQRSPIGSKAICQQRDVLDVWEMVGVGARLAAEGVTWSTARTFYRDHEIKTVRFFDRGSSPLPPWINISQARTEALLDEKLAQAPLVDVRWGHRAIEIDQDARGVVVTCETGGARTQIACEYAIVCTGARDRGLRERLGVRFEGTSYADKFLICDIRCDLEDWKHERRFYFDPAWNTGRQVLIHACPGSTFRIDWQVPHDYDLDEDVRTGASHARIEKILGRTPYEILWQSAYRFQSRCVDRMVAGRVLFAGDAAHLVAPFGARGLNSGVQDAENAAWKIAFVLKGWAPSSLVQTYDEERRAAALENLDVTDRTMRFLVPQTEAEHRRRTQLLERAVVDPGAAAQIDSGRFAEPFWYVASSLTTPDARRPFGGRPPEGSMPSPSPGVLVPDHAVDAGGRLRELARSGLLALAGDGVDVRAAARALAELGGVPWTAHAFRALTADGSLAEIFAAGDDEIWLVRPDGHVAAVVTDRDPLALLSASRRALGRATRQEGSP
jgi:3-(3-hydroxy-phenyl)propionate hydroxylase